VAALELVLSNRLTISRRGLPLGVLEELRTLFTADNPKRGTKKSAPLVDGEDEPAEMEPETISCHDEGPDSLSVPRGALPEVVRVLQRAGIHGTIRRRTVQPPSIPMTRREGVSLFPYQETAVQAALSAKGGVVQIPCGGGKTVVGMEIVARSNTPALWLCHTADLARQAVECARNMYGMTDVGLFGDNSESMGERLTVGLVQSLTDKDLSGIASQFGCVVLDEAHHAPADTFRTLIEQFPADIRLGLTATPERRDGLHTWMHAMFGPTVYAAAFRDIAAAGRIMLPDVGFVRTGVGAEKKFPDPAAHWSKALKYLSESETRNKLILDLTARMVAEGRRCLIVVWSVKHVALLTRELEARGIPAVHLVGDVSSKKRAEFVAAVRRGDARVAVATTVADEGLDIPELDTVFMASPTRSAGLVTQRAGRVMRVSPTKQPPLVIDLVDEHSMYEFQASKRLEVYRQTIGARILPRGAIAA